MSKHRIKTSASFQKLLPFSGDRIPVPPLVESGLFHHLALKMPSGGRVILSVPQEVARNYPEYFKDY